MFYFLQGALFVKKLLQCAICFVVDLRERSVIVGRA